MAKHGVPVSVLMVFLVMLSCRDYQTKNGYVTRASIGSYLSRLEKGISYNNSPVVHKVVLNDIEEYLFARTEAIYGRDKAKYTLHRGLIKLYKSEFLSAFRVLREYVRQTGDYALPSFHVGQLLDGQFTFAGDFLLGVAALRSRADFPSPLDLDQQLSIIASCMSYPYRQMSQYLTEEILDRRELVIDPRNAIRYYQQFVLTRNDIETLYGIFILEEQDIKDAFVGKLSFDTAELDYLVAFYVHPYHQDFGKAAGYASMRDYKTWYPPNEEYRVVNLMRAFLGVDDYEKALRVHASHVGSFAERWMSRYHVNLLASAAYAGLGDLDTALEYLEKDLALSEIYSGELSNPRTISDLPQRGDMLHALYELVFVFEEFDAFERAGRYGELEEVVARNVARYKHLRLFNR